MSQQDEAPVEMLVSGFGAHWLMCCWLACCSWWENVLSVSCTSRRERDKGMAQNADGRNGHSDCSCLTAPVLYRSLAPWHTLQICRVVDSSLDRLAGKTTLKIWFYSTLHCTALTSHVSPLTWRRSSSSHSPTPGRPSSCQSFNPTKNKAPLSVSHHLFQTLHQFLTRCNIYMSEKSALNARSDGAPRS